MPNRKISTIKSNRKHEKSRVCSVMCLIFVTGAVARGRTRTYNENKSRSGGWSSRSWRLNKSRSGDHGGLRYQQWNFTPDCPIPPQNAPGCCWCLLENAIWVFFFGDMIISYQYHCFHWLQVCPLFPSPMCNGELVNNCISSFDWWASESKVPALTDEPSNLEFVLSVRLLFFCGRFFALCTII